LLLNNREIHLNCKAGLKEIKILRLRS
jgi:hypothetical protein